MAAGPEAGWFTGTGHRAAFRPVRAAAVANGIVEAATSNTPRAIKTIFRIFASIEHRLVTSFEILWDLFCGLLCELQFYFAKFFLAPNCTRNLTRGPPS
jgi:hypothetical protein